MMYGLMIEQWEDERALYVERCDEMQRNDEYGSGRHSISGLR